MKKQIAKIFLITILIGAFSLGHAQEEKTESELINFYFGEYYKQLEDISKTIDKQSGQYKNIVKAQERLDELKKKTEKGLDDKIQNALTKKAKQYLRKKGLPHGYAFLKKIEGNKKTIDKYLKYAKNFYSADWDNIQADLVDDAVGYLLKPFPGADQAYTFLKWYKKQWDELWNDIRRINMDALAKKMINDDQLFALSGKAREEYFFSKYLGYAGEKATPLQPVFMNTKSEDRNIVLQRATMVDYAKSIESGKAGTAKGQTPWDGKSNLIDDYDKMVWFYKHFFVSKILTVYKQKQQLLDMQAKVKEEAETMEEIAALAPFEDFINDYLAIAQSEAEAAIKLAKQQEPEEKEDTSIVEQLPKPKPVDLNTMDRIEKAKVLERANKQHEKNLKEFADIQETYNKNKIKYYEETQWNDLENGLWFASQDQEDPTDHALNIQAQYIMKLDYFVNNMLDRFEIQKFPVFYNHDYSRQVEQNKTNYVKFSKTLAELNGALSVCNSYLNSESPKKYLAILSKIKLTGIDGIDYGLVLSMKRFITDINGVEPMHESVKTLIETMKEELQREKEIKEKLDKQKKFYRVLQSKTTSFTDFVQKAEQAVISLRDFLSSKNMKNHDADRASLRSLINIMAANINTIYASAECSQPFMTSTTSLLYENWEQQVLGKYDDQDWQSYYKKQIDIASSLEAQMVEIKNLSSYYILNSASLPMYENRAVTKEQSEIDKERATIIKNAEKTIIEINSDLSKVNKLRNTWDSNKKDLNSFIKQYMSNSPSNPRLIQTNSSFQEETEKKVLKFEVWVEKFKQTVISYNKRIREQKTEADRIDKQENDRIYKYFSEIRFNEISNYLRNIKFLKNDIQSSEQYFPIYIETDIAKAKILYMYLYNKFEAENNNYNQVERLYLEGFHKDYQAKATTIFSDIADTLLDMDSILANMKRALEKENVRTYELEQNAHKIDSSEPISKLIYGELDSDNDGVPDSVEIGLGTDPTNEESGFGIISGTATISGGQSLNFSSKTVSTGTSSSLGNIFVQPNFGGPPSYAVLHGAAFEEITGRNTVPKPVGSNYKEPAPKISGVGKTYAMTWFPENAYFAVVKIIRNPNSNTVVVDYWFKPDGGTFSF
ncbi:MAG: thrombospondin type 3 repeat-containing protein [Candidatus Margulisbacteria bacterium]|nr:thrombospondin type 3 repeat-containing protein [Candidatus Margulisiibacteriota bacterium]